MRLPLPRSIALALPLALLAACADEPEADDGRSASGEVLEGTISDEMLPLYQLQSKPPLLEPERAPAAVAAGDDEGEPRADGEEADVIDEGQEPEAEELAEPADE